MTTTIIVTAIVTLLISSILKNLLGRNIAQQQEAIMFVIKHHEQPTGATISDITGISMSTIYVILARMEEKKLISRIQVPSKYPNLNLHIYTVVN